MVAFRGVVSPSTLVESVMEVKAVHVGVWWLDSEKRDSSVTCVG